jgi:hypothetical protein
MYSKRKVSRVFNNNPQGSRLRGRPKKTDGGTAYKQILTDAKLKTGKIGQKNRVDWGQSIKEAKVCIGL